MAVVIYLMIPSSNEVSQQQFYTRPTPEFTTKERAKPEYSSSQRTLDEFRAAPRNKSREILVTSPPEGSNQEVVQQEQTTHWEELAFSDQSDLQTRAESLVSLAELNPARGEYAYESMILSDNVNDRQLAIALLRDWRNRSRDPDGRIEDLLMRAASDPDAGVAYQAKAALGLVGSDHDQAQPYPSSYEGAEAWEAGVQY